MFNRKKSSTVSEPQLPLYTDEAVDDVTEEREGTPAASGPLSLEVAQGIVNSVLSEPYISSRPPFATESECRQEGMLAILRWADLYTPSHLHPTIESYLTEQVRFAIMELVARRYAEQFRVS